MGNNINLTFTNNINNLNRSIQSLQSRMSSLTSSVQRNSTSFNGSNRNLNRFSNGLRRLNTDANRAVRTIGNLGNSFNRLNSSLNGTINMIKVMITYKLAEFFAGTIQSSMDMIETVNLFNVSLGEMATEANRALVELSAITGLDLNNLREATGTYTLLARSMGMASEQASVLGLNTTKLALDLSSLMNVPINQVYADLRSGLLGQTETVYKYGVDLTEATLQQTAFNLGLTQSVRTMRQGQKMWLRYETLIRQTTLAQADLARTIEQPANQLRILGERIVTLGRAIGSVFINAISGILPYLNAFISILTMLFQTLASFFGVELPKIENTMGGMDSSGASDAIDKVGNSAGSSAEKVEDLAKALKDTSLGFDEFNTVQKQSDTSPSGGSGSGGTGGIGSGGIFDFALSEYDNKLSSIKSKADEIVDKFLEWLGLTRELNKETGQYEFQLIEGGFVEKLKNAIEAEDWFSVGQLVGQKLSEALSKLNEVIKWENVGDKITEDLNRITSVVNGFFAGFDWTLLGETFGNGLNTAIYSGIILLKGLDFKQIGFSLATAFSSAVRTIDWYALGQLIVEGITSALDFVAGLIDGMDWSAIASAIYNFLKGAITSFLEWYTTGDAQSFGDNLVRRLITLIGGAKIGGIIGALVGLFTPVGPAVGSMLGQAIGAGIGLLLPEIINILSNIFSWENTQQIFQSAIDKIALGFESLNAGKLGEAGMFILEGIMEGFVGAIAFLVEPIGQFFQTFVEAVASIFGIHSPAENVKFLGEYILKGIVEGFKSKISEFTTAIENWFEQSVKPWFTSEKWSELYDTVRKALVDKWTELVSWWQTSAINNWWTNDVATWFTIDKWKTMYDNIKTALSEKWSEITDWWSNTAIVGWWNDHVSPYFTKEKWYGLLKGMIDGIKQGFKDAFNGAIGMVESAMNFIIEKINTLSWTVPDWVPGIGGETWGFNFSPIEIPRLARGGMLQGGQLFVAGEFGKAEMVGSYNGKTTVMPLENTDFVNAIYNAVFSAMQQSQSYNGGQVIENVVNLDGEVIYRNQQKVSARKGTRIGSINFAR